MLQFTDYGTEGRKKNNAFRANRFYGENLYGKGLECYLSKKKKILEKSMNGLDTVIAVLFIFFMCLFN